MCPKARIRSSNVVVIAKSKKSESNGPIDATLVLLPGIGASFVAYACTLGG